MEEMKRVSTTPQRLREALERARIKPLDLARAAGMSHSSVSRYLAGKVEPKSGAVHKMAKVLMVSELWLWGYNVPRQRNAEQQKNDELVTVISKLRSDPDFFEVVSALAGLPKAQYDSVKTLLTALCGK